MLVQGKNLTKNLPFVSARAVGGRGTLIGIVRQRGGGQVGSKPARRPQDAFRP